MLKLENIGVIFRKNSGLERKVLHQLDLCVKDSEFIVIIGDNGSGKSTLFNVISGFIKADLGKIMIAGQDMHASCQRYRANLVSKVVQDPKIGTMENMTILENMAFAFKRGQRRGLHLFMDNKRVNLFKEKLGMLDMGLENRLDDLVHTLSGGQRQALSIIMATMHPSKIILLDEITAALDPASSTSVMALSNRLVREQKLTCIMITHNMDHALTYGDRILLLKDGSFKKEYDIEAKATMTSQTLASALSMV